MTLTKEQISEIAGKIEMGYCCFINKQSGKLLFAPEFGNGDDAEELFPDEFEELERNSKDYLEIEKPQSRDSFVIMEKFTVLLDDSEELKTELLNALKLKNPFRNFNFIIHNSEQFKDKWFVFKTQELETWVLHKFEEVII